MKKIIMSLSLTLGITILPTTFAQAANADLNKEQKTLQEDFSNSTLYVQTMKDTKQGQMSTSAATYSNRLTSSRGSFLAWSKSYVDWVYSSGKVKSSSAHQQVGYVFPNKVVKNGSTRYYKGSTKHKWRHSSTLKMGTPTPWGDVNFVSNTAIDRVWVNGKGKYGRD